jgi:hypothetical protein
LAIIAFLSVIHPNFGSRLPRLILKVPMVLEWYSTHWEKHGEI